MSVDNIQKAVDAFISGNEWSKARRVARELEPRLESYVETKYKEALKVSVFCFSFLIVKRLSKYLLS